VTAIGPTDTWTLEIDSPTPEKKSPIPVPIFRAVEVIPSHQFDVLDVLDELDVPVDPV
jgi:hypothetical protein